ncbi:MAG: T9SS type A sorting domain-containing protein [Ignavibacteria bacterium]|nr:T9SS type A sorting domain-containing protein [Ignavibacteria bacterium]
MKMFLLFVFILLVSNNVIAKNDSVFVKIQADTVQIWNTDVSANCASRFSLSTEITGNSIVVTECDTIGPLVHCLCIFDLHSSLTGLPAGNYSVAVYRQELKKYFYSHDTTIFVDSLTFTLLSSSTLPKEIQSNQSACHTATSIEKEETNPETFLLLSNYPNPFNPSTVISYQLAVGGFVSLKVYDILGNEIATLVNEVQKPGKYAVGFDTANKLSSGIYFSRLTVDGSVRIRKMVVLK